MTSRSYYIAGAGGFGREVAQLLADLQVDQSEFALLGFVDDDHTIKSTAAQWGTVRSTNALEDLAGNHFVVGIGHPSVRASMTRRLEHAGLLSGPALVHPRSWIGRFVKLGEGTVVCANSSLTTDIELGRHVHVNINCTVGHDAVLEDYVTLSPGVSISGNVRIGQAVEVGTGAVVLPGLTVGQGAVVGAGAVVAEDVAAGATVVGIPARAISR